MTRSLLNRSSIAQSGYRFVAKAIRSTSRVRVPAVACVVFLTACATSDLEDPTGLRPEPDSGLLNTAPPDAAPLDAGSQDSSVPDATSPDPSVPDATSPDPNVPDATSPNPSDPDASSPDNGAPDPSDPQYLSYVADVVRDAAGYISFDYSANGCHDRSVLLSAELAAAGVPTNAQSIVPTGEDGSGRLTPRPYPGLEWNYHVAPVVFLPGSDASDDDRRFMRIRGGEVVGDIDDHAYIVDPALYPKKIVAPLATWVNDLTQNEQDAFLSLDDAREALNTPSDEARAIEFSSDTVIPTSLAEMPKLWQFQLGGSCSFLSRDARELEDELGSEAVEEIRRKMNVGVWHLLKTMRKQKLLLMTEPIHTQPCWDL